MSQPHLTKLDAEQQPKVILTNLAISTAIFIVGVILSFVGQNITRHAIIRNAEIAFSSISQDIKDILLSRIREYVTVLNSTKALYGASDEVSRVEYTKYLDSLNISNSYRGFSTVYYSAYVTDAQKTEFEKVIREDQSLNDVGYPNFEIKPTGTRAEYLPITYAFPNTPANLQHLGTDLLQDAIRGPANIAARDQGEVIFTAPTQLLGTQRSGFLAVIPIYANNTPVLTPAQRQAAFTGTVYAAIDSVNFFTNVFSENTTFSQEAFSLVDITDNRSALIYQSPNSDRFTQTSPTNLLTKVFEIPIGGRQWQLTVTGDLALLVGDELLLPQLILGCGIFLSLSIAGTIFFLLTSRQLALNLAARMTKSLRESQKIISEAKALDEAILSSIGDAVFAIDTHQKIILFNKTAATLSGYTKEEAMGKPFGQIFNFISEKNHHSALGFIDEAMTGKTSTMPKDTILKTKSGKTIPVADSAAPIFGTDDQMKGVVVVFRDTTKERQLDHLKDEFVSLASHELRTPMTAIKGFISMILAGDFGKVPKPLQEPLTDVQTSTDRLIHLVNDMLNVSRIEAGRLKFELSNFDLHPLVEKVVVSLQSLAQQKNLTLVMGKTTHTKLVVQADSDKVAQILNNLIGNSLKFTDEGGITVSLNATPTHAEVRVTDTGIGIAPKDQARLFGKFQQISSQQKSKPNGTGLGLYLSKQLVEKMGGQLGIEKSVVGKGSTFLFSLPLENTAAAKKAAADIEQEAAAHPDQKTT